MIVEIEKPRPSCRASLDYNEEKVLAGVAELVGYANMDSTDRDDIYGLFERYEHTRYYVAEKSFHASVNPSAADACSEEDVLGFISALMDHLGYGGQPYLVYRHFDIEREHYHVVSVRADKEGRKINNHYEKRRASAFMREVAPRYRFSVAEKGSRVTETSSLKEEAPSRVSRFDPRKEVAGQLRAIFNAALSYDQDSFRQLSAVLEDYGVRATLVQGDDPSGLTLQGLDRKGKAATAVFSESDLGGDLYQLAEASWEAHRRDHSRSAREKQRVRSLVGFAFGISSSESHMENILRRKGIGMHLSRTRDTGEVFGITLVDHPTRTVFKGSELRDVISVRAMREAVASGRWRAADRGHGRSAYVRSSRAAAREDAMRLRDLNVGVLARILVPVGQPTGASWSGRTDDDDGKLLFNFDDPPKGGEKIR